MESKHTDIGHGSNVIPFARPRRVPAQPGIGTDREKAIIDHYRRRLKFERKVRSGLLTDAEEIQGDMELRAEVFRIADQFGI